ncbi:hypothetical protein SDC9_67607 [bioreactor metagenome]|uniref:LicD/FKTN/FKRP nucleotidyltransferase domain-containing protein n=1 Tax=bioreactor metagenome TaxID=1076179 RepID=A0A644Y4S6_9ZZZZ
MRKKTVKEISLTAQQLRQLQLIQLEMLLEVDRICTQHSIRYSIDGGTLLGAVRHGGFIPWDDDIDLIMTRKEYEKFFEVCRTALDTERFFLQEHRTDPHYRVGYSRLRRKHTVYIRAGHEGMNYHTGVLIDIFVLDNVPDAKSLRCLHRGLCFCFRKILWSKSGSIVSDSAFVRGLYALISFIPPGFAFWGFDALARVCNRRKTLFVKHYAMTYPNPRRNGFGTPAGFMDAYTRLPFEGHMVCAVSGYDAYLTLLYSDYMTPPPPEQRKPRIHLSAFSPVNDDSAQP